MHEYYKTIDGNDRRGTMTREQVQAELDRVRSEGIEFAATDKGVGYVDSKGRDVHFRCYCEECHD
jgi:hypothetical protein